MQTQAFKVCPKCQQPAVLNMAQCARCGHVYQTAQIPQAHSSQGLFCPTCQRWIQPADGAAGPFCPSCGFRFWEGAFHNPRNASATWADDDGPNSGYISA